MKVFNREIDRLGLDWEAFQEPGQQTDESSARRPDVAIVPTDFVDAELDQSAVLVSAAFLVVFLCCKLVSISLFNSLENVVHLPLIVL